MVAALGVPIVQHPVYPYDKSLPFDDIMSFITGTSIQWSFDPWITSHELTETHYLFFQISCYSIWPISHLHTVPLERCTFLYAFVSYAPMSYSHLFIRSLIEVHRSSSTAHALFFPVFIHRILLHLGLDEFPIFESVHIIAPIGATFLRQRTAQMRVSSKYYRVEFFDVAPPPPSSTGDTTAEVSVDPAAATTIVPSPSTSDDFDIRRMLEIVMTVQAAYGQLLVDMLDELHALRADLEHIR